MTRVIKSGSAAQDGTSRPRTVVIPNGTESRPRPDERGASTFTAFGSGTDEGRGAPVMKTVPAQRPETAARPEPPAPAPEPEPEDDVKVFTPRRPSLSRPRQSDGYIEPSPYEKLKQPLEEYKASREAEEQPAEVEGQIVTDELIKPAPAAIPASAVAAYKGYGSTTAADDDEFRKADFSHILDGIKREDGFSRDEDMVDSDGLPVSHKTKHVMNALFGPTKVSPILRVKLDEDDEDM